MVKSQPSSRCILDANCYENPLPFHCSSKLPSHASPLHNPSNQSPNYSLRPAIELGGIFSPFRTGAFRKKGGEKKLTSFARKVSVGARLFRNRVGDLNNLAASRTPLRFPTPVMLSFEPLPSSRVNNLSPIFPTLFLAYIIIWSRIDTIFRNNFSKQTD